MDILVLRTGIMSVNTFILHENGEAVVVDAGGDVDLILSALQSKNLTLKAILLTHGHFDHTGAVADLKAATNAKVYLHKLDCQMLKETNFNWDFFQVQYSVKPFDIDVQLEGGELLKLINHDFKVVHTAGHTLGSVCYILDDNVILTGDTLFCGSVGRTDMPYSSESELAKSLKVLAQLGGDYEILTGHGLFSNLQAELNNNYEMQKLINNG